MSLNPLSLWITSCLLLGMRIAPVFAFAPPFTLVRVPRLFRLLFGLGLAICLVSAQPQQVVVSDLGLANLIAVGTRELLLGTVFVLAFQIVFGAMYFAGRTLDIQAGLGFAVLVDPASRGQRPLVGTLFAYAAGAVFFAMNGHLELLRMFSSSLEAIPIGAWTVPQGAERIAAFMSLAFLNAIGIAAATMLALFLADILIAVLCRTVPQMNVLVLGFQVKTLILLMVLPVSFGIAGAQFLRMMSMSIHALPGML